MRIKRSLGHQSIKFEWGEVCPLAVRIDRWFLQNLPMIGINAPLLKIWNNLHKRLPASFQRSKNEGLKKRDGVCLASFEDGQATPESVH